MTEEENNIAKRVWTHTTVYDDDEQQGKIQKTVRKVIKNTSDEFIASMAIASMARALALYHSLFLFAHHAGTASAMAKSQKLRSIPPLLRHPL